jgi:CBS domain-containing protein
MREGARASHITRVIAEINDRVLAKIVQLAEKQLGAPPVPYCWVALGSEGRREQTFKTDQDNALIHADTSDDLRADVERYFAEFCEFAASALARCGYPRCEGGYMASNRRWRQPLSAWKRQFRAWITDADQRSAQDALISFDMRPVAGDPSLCAELWEYNRELLKTANLFKSIFAWVSLDHKPPMGFFRSRVVLRNGELRNRLDLKLQGTGPIVNAVRMFALDAGLPQTNTLERLSALQQAGYADTELLNELREALELLTLLRLECQLQQSKEGQPLSNFIEPSAINQLHRALLKQAFHSVERAQSLVKSNFETWVWARLD